MTTHLLVTGAAGFIGSQYVRTLLGPGGPPDVVVTALDALTYAGNPDNLAAVRGHPRYRFERGDICDAALVDRVMAGQDQVVHLAAESHVDRSLLDASVFVRTNVHGTQTLLDAATRHGVASFVQVSTDEVYGSLEHGSWTEDEPLRPNSPYSASKASGDLLAMAHHVSHGLDVRVTRCSNNYGPRQFPEKLIPRFITLLMDGHRVPLYGDGLNVREWLHVDDHVRGIEAVRTRGRAGRVYNIGGGATLSNKELVGLLLEAAGADWGSVEYVEDRKGHDRRYAVDSTRIQRELGFAPAVDLADGLAATVAWYHKHRSWWEPLVPAGSLPA
ncbi:dTDP-glucose 4,6-dehydratase [Streptomyces sp. MnatMP-M77]|uniref:dTDP-glucose 4,6-dehydratase n=1 Tax=unclassified Streptomyces TaxID=2593676 RepID=UPI000805399C|nr:dTDP-glucose 4,6-dehydratase [Streptomyces sp. MnatMP-M77]MYT82967.1 dTDP-glucose 4,6-dehydratase [Streptomyces sp. SID8364]SBU95120.1 dTDP-glucose 4,6-dehydratase [Streptomyces sp. MnatMP-M77]